MSINLGLIIALTKNWKLKIIENKLTNICSTPSITKSIYNDSYKGWMKTQRNLCINIYTVLRQSLTLLNLKV